LSIPVTALRNSKNVIEFRWYGSNRVAGQTDDSTADASLISRPPSKVCPTNCTGLWKLGEQQIPMLGIEEVIKDYVRKWLCGSERDVF
jgi:hypothetical protein